MFFLDFFFLLDISSQLLLIQGRWIQRTNIKYYCLNSVAQTVFFLHKKYIHNAMKRRIFTTMSLVVLLTFLHVNAYSQDKKHGHLYGTLQVFGYSHDKGLAAGPHFSFGYYNDNFGIGPGMGIIITGGDEPYIPIYVNVTYAGGKSKISPMGQFQFGKGIQGGGDFIEEDIYMASRAGFYGAAKMGVALKFKKNRLHVLGGITLMTFQVVTGSTVQSFNNSMFTFGIGLFTTN